MIAWMRRLEIILTSKTLKKTIVFGHNWQDKQDDLTISVSGTKYLSALKDACVVKIENASPKEITTLILGEFYEVEVKAGYRTGGLHTIFKGEVLYYSNVLGDRKSNTLVIFCASPLVARYGQTRMNLSLNSGINMYNLLEFICRRAGIPNSNISKQFKGNIIRESISQTKTIGSFLEGLSSANNLLITSDATNKATVNIWNPAKTDLRRIVLDPSTIILTAGYPTLSTEGLKMSVMPTFNFMPGDTIVVDNSMIDLGMDSYAVKETNRGYYLDENGEYVIFQIDYNLENRSSEFSLNILCKAKKFLRFGGYNIYGGQRNG